MGLNHPEDLVAWRRWQESQHALRRFKAKLVRPPAPSFTLFSSGTSPSILVVVDAPTPSQIAAYLEPALQVEGANVAVLAQGELGHLLPEQWTSHDVVEDSAPDFLAGVGVVFASGHFLPASALAHQWARELDARFVVAQHGLLTPFQPPLPPNAHALAFTEQDADFWKSGRSDVTHDVVGSQMLWNAAKQRAVHAEVSDRPVFLGQLHGAELARRTAARTAQEFCTSTGASYRPHPAEVDKLSRLQHRQWQRAGIVVDESRVPLRSLARPVVSIFSTGVLEAAAAGRPAWVTCANAPDWIREFWARYSLAEWGGEPSPAPIVPPVEPAQAIAASLARILEGTA